MELKDLIQELERHMDSADIESDAGHVDEAREHLRQAKDILDEEFLND